MATVLSVDPDIDPDIPALIGASAAVSIAGIPFAGPIGAARVGYADGEYILNPTLSQLVDSDLDLVVAGTEAAVLMVESEANALSEEVMLGAVLHGHQQMQPVISAINDLSAEIGNPKWEYSVSEENPELASRVENECGDAVRQAFSIAEKMSRQDALAEVRSVAHERLGGETDSEGERRWSPDAIGEALYKLEKSTVRSRIIANEPRIDGRDNETVRAISSRVGVLPRTHGSALFTRGETQALVVTTLGSGRDSQIIDAIEGERREPFMFHYNFPPYSVGETGRNTGPKRREIGHGRLAKRGIMAVMPSMDEFPYVIRVVSEITESNGSSSMASVCGSSMSLMDAGVPIKAPVAGIAMGLIKEGEAFAVLSDILGDEDHLGDMDFKVAGTEQGVNALQMDIKIDGITREIMEKALEQAKAGRLHILAEMAKTITEPRSEMSEFAPRIISFTINPEKIRDVIGKGGATIRSIT